MRDVLGRLLKLVNFLWKILPVLIDALQDLADDGSINGSTKRSSRFNQPDTQE